MSENEQINMFRSEAMEYMQFVLPREAAYQTTYELGRLGAVHFRDMNSRVNANKREFYGEIRRCDEMMRVLRFFRNQLDRNDIVPVENVVEKQYNFADLEARFDEVEKDIRLQNQHEEEFFKYKMDLVEMKYCIDLGAQFFENQPSNLETVVQTQSGFQSSVASSTVKFGYLAGVISHAKLDVFHRIIVVATRGNIFFNSVPIPEPLTDPTTEKQIDKHVFVIFFSGTHTSEKITKICEAYGASLYDFPETNEARSKSREEIIEKLDQLVKVQEKMEARKHVVLNDLQENVSSWASFLVREKAIFHTLNLFSSDNTSKCLVGEAWVPTRSVSLVHESLAKATSFTSTSLPSLMHQIQVKKTPPTFIRTNKVTEGFQSIVNSFGTATYQEVNPGLFTIFSFPFLFALMFGDFGHGILLTLVGAFFVIFEKKLAKGLNDIVEFLYIGRYMLLLMGFQATFCGLMYNECFSLSMNLLGSGYTCEEGLECVKNSTYWLGIDPIWRQTYNNLIFSNSIKMKLSIIVGVSQMVVGIIFSFLNHRHFKRAVNVWCEFVPQILLMLSLFGYLSFLIIYKWVVHTKNSPLLIRTMIDMFLNFSQPIDPNEQLYPGQELIQRTLLVITLLTIPWMLIPKPVILIYQHIKEVRAKKKEELVVVSDKKEKEVESDQEALLKEKEGEASLDEPLLNFGSSSSSSGLIVPAEGEGEGLAHHPEPDDEGEEEFNIGELCVHQLIETIEFALGCVSNTASYLRLWALSLAHGQLAEVFFDYAMIKVPAMVPGIGSFVGVPVWLGATFVILMAMEGLSAFLHCLRLHWVEFQNKFYKAEGYDFIPLDFPSLIADDERIAYEQRLAEAARRTS